MTAVGVTIQEQRGWSSVTAAGLHVLVRWDDAHPGLAAVRAATASGDLDEVLDALTRDGVRQAPDFVVVQDGAPARVVARGGAYAVVSAPSGEVAVRAGARGPWADEDAPTDAVDITLRTGEPEPEPQPETPSAPAGWRLPSRLGRGRAAEQEPAAVPARTDATADDVEELPSYDHLFGATQHRRPDPATPQYIEPHDTDSISEPGIGQAPVAAAGGFSAPAPQSDQTLPPPPDTERVRPAAGPAAGQPAPVGPPPAAATPPPAPATAPAAPAVPPPTAGGLIDSVPWRSGGTNVAPPEPPQHTAPQPPVRPAGVHTPPPAPTLRPMGPPAQPAPAPAQAPAPPAPAPAPPAPAPADPPPAPPAVSAAVPPPSPPVPATHAAEPAVAPDLPPAVEPTAPVEATAPVEPTATVEPDDDAEATVDRSALLAAAAQVETGPLVPAVLCPAGHPSPPHAGTCRACGREIPPQQPFQTARPPLGVLRLATGDVVSLDRGVLLGRSPKVKADLPAADRPHLVRVPSPENDISRNHLEVVLEGWHVLVRDLGSTNGTTVALPGQVPVRLRAGDQQVIEPGTIVTMADEVSLTFEVGA